MKKITYPPALKFIHLREPDTNGSRGGATMAYISDVDADGAPVVKIAVAFCHPNDNFSKHLGRVKAYGRLTSLMQGKSQPDNDRYWIIHTDDPKESAEQVASDLASNFGYTRFFTNV